MKSPFFQKTISCPACGEPASHTLLSSALYYSAEKESDGHTSRYGWRKTDVKKTHPPLYSLISCPLCMFTDLVGDYTKAPNTSKSRATIKNYKNMLPSEQKIIRFIYSLIHLERRSHADALAQHLIALFIYEQTPEEDQDIRKIARLFLRIAWIYREKDDLDQYLANFTKKLKNHWFLIPSNENDALNSAIIFFTKAVDIDPFYQDNRNYINALKLIGDLYMRLNDLDGALTFFEQVKHRSLAEKRKFELIYRDKLTEESMRAKSRVELMRISGFIRDVEGICDDLVDQLNVRDAHIINPILAGATGPEEALKRLSAQGLHEAQLRRLERGGRLPQTKKRFGLF
ncbi:DUF2225 domain-containing protein [Myxococcota bacterium]|nr:DUF2225 domain-containing protein [Myxococcota bacterium]MBU1899634.1 DUF2225 domain-containing protein [Myxococcota bacterium]